MSSTVKIPSGMRHITNGQDEVSVSGDKIAEIISNLESTFPGIRELLCDDQGNMLKFVTMAIDGIDVRTINGLDTEVPDKSKIDIVRAIAGG